MVLGQVQTNRLINLFFFHQKIHTILFEVLTELRVNREILSTAESPTSVHWPNDHSGMIVAMGKDALFIMFLCASGQFLPYIAHCVLHIDYDTFLKSALSLHAHLVRYGRVWS